MGASGCGQVVTPVYWPVTFEPRGEYLGVDPDVNLDVELAENYCEDAMLVPSKCSCYVAYGGCALREFVGLDDAPVDTALDD